MQDRDPVLVERLAAINLEDMLISLGWDQLRFGRGLLAWPFREAARRFALQVLDYDACVASLGLQAGSQQFLKSILKQLIIQGQCQIPASGPVLFLSNHPGMMDTVSLFASIPRQDLKTVAAERPFLRALPAISNHLIYVPDETGERIQVIRQAAQALRQGGAVLTFPAGHIEPDPAILPGAMASLADWGNSIGMFARLVPNVALVPVLVSGVLARKATHHPLTRLRRMPKNRERLGATIQILASVIWPEAWKDFWNVTIRVRFGAPIFAELLVGLHEPARITSAVMNQVKAFYQDSLVQDGYSSST